MFQITKNTEMEAWDR